MLVDTEQLIVQSIMVVGSTLADFFPGILWMETQARAQLLTSLKADHRQDINRGFTFSRFLKEALLW